jgi:histidinol-phosphatase (PHP family)
MERTCARAVELGLPSVAFTDHAEFAAFPWAGRPVPNAWRVTVTPDRMLAPPPFPVVEYLESVQRCRERFPGLRILSGVELSEPHWHGPAVADLLRRGGFDRVLGSVHALAVGGPVAMPIIDELFAAEPAEMMRTYLAEVTAMIATSDAFAVLAHIDYGVRYWPAAGSPFDPATFEEEFRTALRALAASGRALEINTTLPLAPDIVRWWHDVGGDAVAFGSDAHNPMSVARDFEVVAAMAAANGFQPGRYPFDLWRRC